MKPDASEPGDKLRLSCPDCQAEIVIDRRTGAVLSHRAKAQPLAGGKSFESLFAALGDSQSRAEEVFEREKAAFADRDRLLEEKFREALKRAADDPTPAKPNRPFDLD